MSNPKPRRNTSNTIANVNNKTPDDTPIIPVALITRPMIICLSAIALSGTNRADAPIELLWTAGYEIGSDQSAPTEENQVDARRQDPLRDSVLVSFQRIP